MRPTATFPALAALALFACAEPQPQPVPQSDPAPAANTPAVAATEPAPTDPAAQPGPVDTRPDDGAEIVSASFPASLACGATSTATVVVKNTGKVVWDANYRLGGVDDSDPFAEARAYLPAKALIAPGETATFTLALTAPATAGSYVSDWRMVHELVRWFGETHRSTIAVTCAPPPPPPPPASAELDLALATILNNPQDLASWPIGTRITKLEIRPDAVHVEFDKRDGPGRWPDVTPPGWDGPLQYTLGMAMQINGRWYASAAIQFWYGLDASGGPPDEVATNWYYDAIRWGAMTGHQPAVGETVGYFVVAGNVRNVLDDSQAPVRERSNVVLVPFPGKAGGTFTFP